MSDPDFKHILDLFAKQNGKYKQARDIARELFTHCWQDLPESKRVDYRNILWEDEMTEMFKEEESE